MRETGFQVMEAHDLSAHLRTSYQCLAEITQNHPEGNQGNFQALGQAYTQMVNAVDEGELGWGLYVCRK